MNLNAVIDGKPQQALALAWYAAPVTATLLVGGIVLVVGFMVVIAAGQADSAPER